jgi:hypothetical protein
MKKINLNKVIITSAVQTVPKKEMIYYAQKPQHIPQAGDVVFARIKTIGQHTELENRNARIHRIFDQTLLIGALGNRYATDYFEGIIPGELLSKIDLLARGGVIGLVKSKYSSIKDPTKLDILGYVLNKNEEIVNTRNYKIKIKSNVKQISMKNLILVVGSSMNAGKSTAAKALIYSLVVKNKSVAAGKVTGTASLKDLLLMEDSGANEVIDFTYLGYPSTYLLNFDIVIDIFEKIYSYLSTKAKDYIVIEIADGILQRETAFLLGHPSVQEKIYKLIFCCSDSIAVRGGVELLKDRYNLIPDAISGRAVNSESGQNEIRLFSSIPMFNSMEVDVNQVYSILE